MTERTKTRKELLASALALLMCVAMFIATTFAWFTDTASTGVNTIQSGTLKVGLQMATAWDGSGNPTTWDDAEGETLSFKKASNASGTDVLWEPGCTYELPEIRVVNEGNLAFKYKIAITGATGDTELLNVIDFTTKFNGEEIDLDSWEGMLVPAEKSATADTTEDVENSSSIVISGHMDENAGNEYQNLTLEGIGITVYATQYTYEYDSYNNTYDLSSMYVFDDYVSVTETVSSSSETVLADKASDPTITATIPSGSLASGITELALIKKPTANPNSVKVETGESALTTDVKIIDTATKQVVSAQGETYFTISIQLGQVDLKEFYHKGVKLTAVDSKDNFTAEGQYYYDFTTGAVTFTTKDFSTFTAVFKFAGGDGTADHPYLIANKGHFAAINDEYDAQKFNYYKIVNSIDTLDLSDVGEVNLYGEFDGNGATVNLNQCLFNKVGKGSKTQTVSVIKNVEAKMNSSSPLVFNIYGQEVTFDNINVSGVIERAWHPAAFVGYGTANSTEGYKGWDYTLNFKNCSCDATIVNTAESGAAILVGYLFQGSGNTCTVNIDDATDKGIENAKLYATGSTVKGYKYYYVGYDTIEIKVNNEELTEPHKIYNATAIGTTAPTKASDGKYSFTPSGDAATVKVRVISQLTSYKEDDTANPGGITNTHGNCYEANISGSEAITVLSKVNKIEIVNELTESNHPEHSFNEAEGILKIYTNSTDNWQTGTIGLMATQYDSNGAAVSSGTLIIAHSTQPTDNKLPEEVTWTIN